MSGFWINMGNNSSKKLISDKMKKVGGLGSGKHPQDAVKTRENSSVHHKGMV